MKNSGNSEIMNRDKSEKVYFRKRSKQKRSRGKGKKSQNSYIDQRKQIFKDKETKEKPKFKTSSSDPMSTPSNSIRSKQVFEPKKKVIFKKINSSGSLDLNSSNSVIITNKADPVRSRVGKHNRRKRLEPKRPSKLKPRTQRRNRRRREERSRDKETSMASRLRRSISRSGLCMRKYNFQKLVREMTDQERRNSSIDNGAKLRITKQALSLLQVTAEMQLIRIIEDAYMCTVHAKRVTLMKRDLELVKKIYRNQQH